MPIIQTATNSYKVDLLSAGHNFNTTNIARLVNTPDVFSLALYDSSVANLDATLAAYTATGEITGTGYSAGGQTLIITQTPQNTGTPSTTAFLNFQDVVWSAASFSADGALIYNVTNANKSVAILNFGSVKTVSNGTFSIIFPVTGTGSAIIQIT